MPITARRHIKKMRGGAQSHLLEGDDGCFYVVKFLNNPQHRRILINELVCTVFLRYLQISCPDAALIEISPEFLRENPQTSFELGAHTVAVSPGRHFGSKFPGDPANLAVYDIQPTVAFQVNEHLSLGAGVNVYLGETRLNRQVSFSPFPDGKVHFRLGGQPHPGVYR